MLYAYIVSLVRNPTDADDVLQETNLVLWRKAGEFDATRPFLPWALRIAQFQVMAQLKKYRRSKLVFDDDLLKLIADEGIEEFADTDPRRMALAGCLQKLPDAQRVLVAERYEPGGSVNSMAEMRRTTPKALSEMLRRIRHSLMLCIEKSTREAFS